MLHSLDAIGRLLTLPAALAFAVVGQFALGWLIITLTPPADPAAPWSTEGAVRTQVVLLLLQGAALVFSVSQQKLRLSRVFLATAALIWAIASMLLFYVALQCDLAAVCL